MGKQNQIKIIKDNYQLADYNCNCRRQLYFIRLDLVGAKKTSIQL